MWDLLEEYFARYPAQSRVAKLMLDRGFSVREGSVYAGDVALTDTALARAADVDRRVVKATVETIEDHDELEQVFAELTPTCHLRDAAPGLGWGVLEIVPTDASQPGILAGVASLIAGEGISIRQAIVDDPEFAEEPRLYIITQRPVPADLLPEIQSVAGVLEVVLGGDGAAREPAQGAEPR
jgi:predicted regulator of amino acid metabolism with ACT domain